MSRRSWSASRSPSWRPPEPTAISGGERQRVALARAVASAPDVLLLDEPLSALDSVTKAQISRELSRWLADLRLPTILVSHDFGDVVGLADRVAVIEEGRIVQVGTTSELLRSPESAFVAAFAGINFFSGMATQRESITEVTLAEGVRIWSTDAALRARRCHRLPLGGDALRLQARCVRAERPAGPDHPGHGGRQHRSRNGRQHASHRRRGHRAVGRSSQAASGPCDLCHLEGGRHAACAQERHRRRVADR